MEKSVIYRPTDMTSAAAVTAAALCIAKLLLFLRHVRFSSFHLTAYQGINKQRLECKTSVATAYPTMMFAGVF